MMRKSLLLLLAVILLGTLALAEPEAFFDNAQINAMIDENYALVQQNGWAELIFRKSFTISEETASARMRLKWDRS